jgi:hypothetical protein
MAGFPAGRWSGGEQLLWSGARPGDRLELEFSVPSEGSYDVVAGLTMARDFAIVQPALDGQPAGDPIDLYHYPDVIASGELNLATSNLTAGPHRLSLEIKGAHPSALKAYLVGLDYLRLVRR